MKPTPQLVLKRDDRVHLPWFILPRKMRHARATGLKRRFFGPSEPVDVHATKLCQGCEEWVYSQGTPLSADQQTRLAAMFATFAMSQTHNGQPAADDGGQKETKMANQDQKGPEGANGDSTAAERGTEAAAGSGRKIIPAIRRRARDFVRPKERKGRVPAASAASAGREPSAAVRAFMEPAWESFAPPSPPQFSVSPDEEGIEPALERAAEAAAETPSDPRRTIHAVPPPPPAARSVPEQPKVILTPFGDEYTRVGEHTAAVYGEAKADRVGAFGVGIVAMTVLTAVVSIAGTAAYLIGANRTDQTHAAVVQAPEPKAATPQAKAPEKASEPLAPQPVVEEAAEAEKPTPPNFPDPPVMGDDTLSRRWERPGQSLTPSEMDEQLQMTLAAVITTAGKPLYQGPVDGQFAGRTDWALRLFQISAGFAPDGVYDHKVEEALRAYLQDQNRQPIAVAALGAQLNQLRVSRPDTVAQERPAPRPERKLRPAVAKKAASAPKAVALGPDVTLNPFDGEEMSGGSDTRPLFGPNPAPLAPAPTPAPNPLVVQLDDQVKTASAAALGAYERFTQTQKDFSDWQAGREEQIHDWVNVRGWTKRDEVALQVEVEEKAQEMGLVKAYGAWRGAEQALHQLECQRDNNPASKACRWLDLPREERHPTPVLRVRVRGAGAPSEVLNKLFGWRPTNGLKMPSIPEFRAAVKRLQAER